MKNDRGFPLWFPFVAIAVIVLLSGFTVPQICTIPDADLPPVCKGWLRYLLGW